MIRRPAPRQPARRLTAAAIAAFGLAAALAAVPVRAAAPAQAPISASGEAKAAARERGVEVAMRHSRKEKEKAAEAEPAAKEAKSGKPVQVGSYGDWGAFLAESAKDKTCYALTKPKERAPAKLKRDPAYVFISSRPGEKVRNEVSVIMGFAMKDGGAARADIGGENFDLIAKGSNAWIKNPAEEARFIGALKKGSKLIVKAPSAKGNVTTDTYSLSGISQALDKVQKDCP